MISYRIRRSGRARYARIDVGGDGVEVVVPDRFPLREVEPFVQQKRPWIERTLRRMAESHAELPPARLEDGGEVPYLGERLALRVRVERGRRRPHVARRGGALHVAVAAPGRELLLAALERWYRRRARAEVGKRLDRACAAAGSGYRSLQIRSQRSRWASCSSSGAMSFNWRLLLAPAEVLDYVEHESWLRSHGHALRL